MANDNWYGDYEAGKNGQLPPSGTFSADYARGQFEKNSQQPKPNQSDGGLGGLVFLVAAVPLWLPIATYFIIKKMKPSLSKDFAKVSASTNLPFLTAVGHLLFNGYAPGYLNIVMASVVLDVTNFIASTFLQEISPPKKNDALESQRNKKINKILITTSLSLTAISLLILNVADYYNSPEYKEKIRAEKKERVEASVKPQLLSALDTEPVDQNTSEAINNFANQSPSVSEKIDRALAGDNFFFMCMSHQLSVDGYCGNEGFKTSLDKPSATNQNISIRYTIEAVPVLPKFKNVPPDFPATAFGKCALVETYVIASTSSNGLDVYESKDNKAIYCRDNNGIFIAKP